MAAPQRKGQLANFALAAEKYQGIARRSVITGVDGLHRVGGADRHIAFLCLEVIGLDRVAATGHFDHRRTIEVGRETLHVDCRRGDNQLQVRPLG